MELQEFITASLTQIARGIEQAAVELKGSSAIVNPRAMVPNSKVEEKHYGYLLAKSEIHEAHDYRQVVEQIEFDVAVTASQGKETKGGIGIMVGSVGVGTQGKSDSERTSQSRLKFRVPMVLPTT